MIVDGSMVDAISPNRLIPYPTVGFWGKLEAYGNVLNWIRGFLSGRTREVLVNGARSSPALVIRGILQRTVVLFV